MARDIDRVLTQASSGRRDFLRRLIAGTVFAPPLLASFSLDGLSVASAGPVLEPVCANQTQTFFSFDFSGDQYEKNFRDILGADSDINGSADDVGKTGHSALNITGHTGSGGNTWATVVDCLPGDPQRNSLFSDQNLSLSTCFLIHRFDNAKGIGLLALAFDLEGERTGNDKVGPDRALGLAVSNAGNNDKLQLMFVDATGKVQVITQAFLGAGIVEDKWYRMDLRIQVASAVACSVSPLGVAQNCPASVTARVTRLNDPSDPDSGLAAGGVVGQLGYQALLPFKDFRGEVGIMARAVNAYVDSSVTNFTGSRDVA